MPGHVSIGKAMDDLEIALLLQQLEHHAARMSSAAAETRMCASQFRSSHPSQFKVAAFAKALVAEEAAVAEWQKVAGRLKQLLNIGT